MNKINKICLKFSGIKEGTKFIIKTKVGTLEVVDREDNEFIPMIFRNDFNLESFLNITFDHSINKHSFKWNLISNDGSFNLEQLENRLKKLV